LQQRNCFYLLTRNSGHYPMFPVFTVPSYYISWVCSCLASTSVHCLLTWTFIAGHIYYFQLQRHDYSLTVAQQTGVSQSISSAPEVATTSIGHKSCVVNTSLCRVQEFPVLASTQEKEREKRDRLHFKAQKTIQVVPGAHHLGCIQPGRR